MLNCDVYICIMRHTWTIKLSFCWKKKESKVPSCFQLKCLFGFFFFEYAKKREIHSFFIHCVHVKGFIYQVAKSVCNITLDECQMFFSFFIHVLLPGWLASSECLSISNWLVNFLEYVMKLYEKDFIVYHSMIRIWMEIVWHELNCECVKHKAAVKLYEVENWITKKVAS